MKNKFKDMSDQREIVSALGSDNSHHNCYGEHKWDYEMKALKTESRCFTD